jgi:hypothetical protein
LATQRELGNTDVIYARAKRLAALNRSDEAQAAYRRYLVLRPDGPQAKVDKAIIRLQERPPAAPSALRSELRRRELVLGAGNVCC